jgi:hypothetical protein
MFAALKVPTIGSSTVTRKGGPRLLPFCSISHFFSGSCRVPGDGEDRSSQIEPFDLIWSKSKLTIEARRTNKPRLRILT